VFCRSGAPLSGPSVGVRIEGTGPNGPAPSDPHQRYPARSIIHVVKASYRFPDSLPHDRAGTRLLAAAKGGLGGLIPGPAGLDSYRPLVRQGVPGVLQVAMGAIAAAEGSLTCCGLLLCARVAGCCFARVEKTALCGGGSPSAQGVPAGPGGRLRARNVPWAHRSGRACRALACGLARLRKARVD
jgi:hypothetical protein